MSSSKREGFSSDILFNLSKGQVSIERETNSKKTAQEELDTDMITESIDHDVILCILWKYGKLGASYYKIEDRQVLV